MDRKVLKLKRLIDQYLNQPKDLIISVFGKPLKKSDNYVWSYRSLSFSPFYHEVLFLFEGDIVVDIMIYEYFLWFEVNSVFHFEGRNPEYKINGC